MTTTTVSKPENIDRLTSGVYPGLAMLAGMQLDLFTPLMEDPMSVQELASALGVGPDNLEHLLYALVTAELLTVQDGEFSNTAEAERFLVQGSPDYMGGRHANLARRWGTIFQTADSIRAGTAQSKMDFSNSSEETLAASARAAHEETFAAGRNLAARYDFSACRNVLDLGGRTGGVSFGLVDAYPQLQATIADLAPTTPMTQRYIEESGFGGRVRAATVNILEAPPQGTFDAAVLRNIIQVFNPSQAAIALKNVIKAIVPGGRIYIDGSVLDDSRLSPQEAVDSSLNFLNIYDGGQSFTEGEYRQWLGQAGFEDVERVELPSGRSIITARKPV